MFTDFFGHDINVGDRVVWSYSNSTSFTTANVTKITTKCVYISRRTVEEERAAEYKWEHKITPNRLIVIPKGWTPSS